MNSRNLIVAFLILVLLLAGIFFFVHKPVEEKTDPLAAVPLQSAVIIKANGLLPLLNSIGGNGSLTALWNKNSDIKIELLTKKLDSIGLENALFYEILNETKIYASVNYEKGENGIFFSIPGIFGQKPEKHLKQLAALWHSLGFTLNPYGAEIENKKNNSWYFHTIEGILVVTNNLRLLKKSVEQLNANKTLLNDSAFSTVYRTSGTNVPATLYLNLALLKTTIKDLLSTNSYLSIEKNLAKSGWLALDLYIEDKNFLFQGFSCGSPANTFLPILLRNEQAASCNFSNIIPQGVIQFAIFSISDAYNLNMVHAGNLKSEPKKALDIKKINEKFGFEINKRLFEIASCAFGQAVVKTDRGIENFAIFKTNSNLSAFDFIRKLKDEKTVNNLKADTINGHTFYVKLAAAKLPNTLGIAIGENNYTHACNIDDYLIFGPSDEALQYYASAVKRGNIQQNDSLYRKIASELMLSRTNISYISFPQRASLYFNAYSNTKKSALQPLFDNSNSLGLQISGNENLAYYNGFITSIINNQNEAIKGPTVQWALNLDTNIVFLEKVQFHFNAYPVFYLAQDAANAIYLVSNNGRILWKKNIDNAILGNISMIDFYKNKKTQLLFNTKSKIYLIDRNGNFVEDFPIEFKNKASNGLAVADFDNNKNYRLYIAFENNSFVVLTKEGRKVDGWKFGKTASKVTQAARCFSFDKKDYILFHDSLNVYLLNRKGEARIKTGNGLMPKVSENIFIENRAKYFRLLLKTANEKILALYPDGKLNEIEIENSINTDFMLFSQGAGDLPPTIITLNNTLVNLYTTEGKLNTKFKTHTIGNKISAHATKDRGAVYLIQHAASDSISIISKNGMAANVSTLQGNYPYVFLPFSDNNPIFDIVCCNGKQLTYYNIP